MGWTDSSDTKITLNEIGMVFYDDNGKLWKYFVTDDYDDHENKNIMVCLPRAARMRTIIGV